MIRNPGEIKSVNNWLKSVIRVKWTSSRLNSFHSPASRRSIDSEFPQWPRCRLGCGSTHIIIIRHINLSSVITVSRHQSGRGQHVTFNRHTQWQTPQRPDHLWNSLRLTPNPIRPPSRPLCRLKNSYHPQRSGAQAKQTRALGIVSLIYAKAI